VQTANIKAARSTPNNDSVHILNKSLHTSTIINEYLSDETKCPNHRIFGTQLKHAVIPVTFDVIVSNPKRRSAEKETARSVLSIDFLCSVAAHSAQQMRTRKQTFALDRFVVDAQKWHKVPHSLQISCT
jgi:hypothetical protein